MVGRADRIAVVDVVSVRSSWNAGHDRIVTAIDLAIVEPWKGDLPAGRHVTVLQPGGTVGDVTTTVDGMPRFTPGERALVFLRGPAERATVVGLTQGKRPVRRDGASGRWMVRAPDRAGADFVRTRAAGDDAARPRRARAALWTKCARRSSRWLPPDDRRARPVAARDRRGRPRRRRPGAAPGPRIRPLLHRDRRALLLVAGDRADDRLRARLQSTDHDARPGGGRRDRRGGRLEPGAERLHVHEDSADDVERPVAPRRQRRAQFSDLPEQQLVPAGRRRELRDRIRCRPRSPSPGTPPTR